jgi:hypothetical protein
MAKQQPFDITGESLVIVYDNKTGQIVHGHHFVTVKGGKHPDRGARESAALEQFLGEQQPKAAAASTQKYSTLDVEPASIQPSVRYKVDIKKGTLVEDRRPGAARKSTAKKKPL